MGYVTLEDYFGDIVGKAMRGLGVNAAAVASASGLPTTDLGRITSYELTPDEEVIEKIAVALSLNPEKLKRVASGWVPVGGNDRFSNERLLVDRAILSVGMVVNTYVLRCNKTGKGALVDAGGQPDSIESLISRAEADISHILVTHGHGDHTGAVDVLKSRTGAIVCCSKGDAGMLGAGTVDILVADGWSEQVGELNVSAHELPGHTVGGIGYYTEGAFFSGDALFAASLGGAKGAAYTRQINVVNQKVMGLPDETKIFPGHGPATTVGQERTNNPVLG